MESIIRIQITGAGLVDVNGNYDICDSISKFPIIPAIHPSNSNHKRHKPEFMYVHLSKDNNPWQYAIYLQPLIEMTSKKDEVWVLAIIGRKNDYKSAPIHLYYAEKVNNDKVPPPNNWKPCGGIEPSPKAQLIQMSIPKKKDLTLSPLQKAIDEANLGNDEKMNEIMFDLHATKGHKVPSHVNKGDKGSTKIKQLIVNPRRSINQPSTKSKDMRRVRGE